MSQIVPRRFGLKYKPRPTIALEYESLEENTGKVSFSVYLWLLQLSYWFTRIIPVDVRCLTELHRGGRLDGDD